MTQDIIPDSNDLALGSGWYPLEVYLSQRFRWVENDAVFYAAMLRPAMYTVTMIVEPGPGVNLKPFSLEVHGDEGKISALDVKGRQSVSFPIVVESPSCQKFRLHVTNGGNHVKDEPRTLNFRVFEIAVKRGPTEVFPGDLALGSGWHPLETFNGETFRWVSNDAEIRLSKAPIEPLVFEVEPGPGVDSKPFTLQILGGDGKELLSTQVRSRQTVKVGLDEVQIPTALRLHAEGGGKRTGNDSRVMNFRVFRHW